jgi:hypothetical protein
LGEPGIDVDPAAVRGDCSIRLTFPVTDGALGSWNLARIGWVGLARGVTRPGAVADFVRVDHALE